MTRRLAGAIACLILLETAAFAQTVSVGWEARRDRYDYHFDNPSSFDTGDQLVDHYFEQSYDADNQWLVGRAQFRWAGRTWITNAGVALWGTGQGDDYDTFFQPSGDVVVYGTTAVTELQSFRIAQHIEMGSPLAFRWRVGYSYRRDRANFLPSDSVTTHTKPPSETRFFNTARETTYSGVQGLDLGIARRHAITNAWSVNWTIDATPITLARLNTVLADKYPGQDIIFIAKAFSAEPSVEFSRAIGGWRLGVRADYAHSWSYSASRQVNRNWTGVGVSIGR